MNRLFQYLMERYGHQSTLNGQDTQVLLQPVPNNSKAAPYAVTSLGTVDDRLWLCYSVEETCPGDSIVWNGKTFIVRTSEQFVLSDFLSYWRAVMEPAKEVSV